MTQKVTQKFQKKISLKKSAPQVANILGGGWCVGPGLENTQIKAAFFMASLYGAVYNTKTFLNGNHAQVKTQTVGDRQRPYMSQPPTICWRHRVSATEKYYQLTDTDTNTFSMDVFCLLFQFLSSQF